MNCKDDPHASLKARIADAVSAYPHSVSQLARLAGVDQGQASRIARGEFRRLSENVMQICKALGVPVNEAGEPKETMKGQLIAELLALWDETPEDARRILQLIAAIRELKC